MRLTKAVDQSGSSTVTSLCGTKRSVRAAAGWARAGAARGAATAARRSGRRGIAAVMAAWWRAKPVARNGGEACAALARAR